MADFNNSNNSETGSLADIDLQDYVSVLPDAQIEVLLEDLELINLGSRFAKADRLYRRLRGEYTAADFIATLNTEDSEMDVTRRKEKLQLILMDTLAGLQAQLANLNADQNENSNVSQNRNSTVNQESDMVITTCVSTDLPVRPTTTATTTTTTYTATSLTTTTHSVFTNNRPMSSFTLPQQLSEQQDRLVQCTLSNGRTCVVPESVVLELQSAKEIAREWQQINRSLRAEMREFATSTQQQLNANYNFLDKVTFRNATTPIVSGAGATTRAKSVQIQDTFDLIYDNNDVSTAQETQATVPQEMQSLNAFAPQFRPQSSLQQSQVINVPPQGYQHSGGRGAASHLQGNRGNLPLGLEATSNTTSNHYNDVGKTVRQWKVRFSGDKNSSIEEFIRRVEECRTLAHIPDEDLLNALTELMTGVALHWCRQSRPQWRTWADFCESARRCYGLDPRLQQHRLLTEALRRSQGSEEPARDYIFCMLTIFSHFRDPWELDRQIDFICDRLRPDVKRLIKRERIRDIDSLVIEAREAEYFLECERNYEPPPSPENSLLPEVAYKPPADSKKPAPVRKPPNLAALSVEQASDLETLFRKILAETAEKNSSKESKSDNASNKDKDSSPKKSNDGKSGEESSRKKSPARNRKPPKNKKDRTPKSDKNKDQAAGPSANVLCYGCSWPGYIIKNCPECSISGNEKEGK